MCYNYEKQYILSIVFIGNNNNNHNDNTTMAYLTMLRTYIYIYIYMVRVNFSGTKLLLLFTTQIRILSPYYVLSSRLRITLYNI